MIEYVIPLINKVLNSGVAFEEWRRNIIIPLPKKGDLSDYNNYRGISLMSIVGKLYNKLLLTRIQPYISKLLRGNQNGFRGNRGTSELILALRRLLEILSKKNSNGGVFTFIDFKKAFDSINRNRMMKILRAYGVSEKVISQINAMYTDTTAAVKSEDGTSDFFEIKTGVLQGDTLAPFLFIIMIDYVMRTALEKLRVDSIVVGITLVSMM